MKRAGTLKILAVLLVLTAAAFAFHHLASAPENAVNSDQDRASSRIQTSGEVVIEAREKAAGRLRTLDNGTVLGGRPAMPPQVRIPDPALARVETVADNLTVPWDMEFTKDGSRLFFTERPGRIQVVSFTGDKPVVSLWLKRPEKTLHWGEGGLMGLALHPDFGSGKKDRQGKPLDWIYLSETYGSTRKPGNRILRVRKVSGTNGGKLEQEVLIDNIPAASFHNGSRLAFGPDGMLYATTGDAGNPERAQDLTSWSGKILRLTPEGKPAPANPFSGEGARPYIYSYGHRNPQGLAWHPDTGDLYASEHGPSGEFGLGGNDEINLIRKGEDYGWPKTVGAPGVKGMSDPLLLFPDPHLPPAGMAFFTGERPDEWSGSLFTGSLRGELLLRAEIDYTGSGPVVTRIERLFETDYFAGTYGRIRAVAMGPDGYLYFATSNRDGRGRPKENDDRIMRLVPSR